MGIRYILVDDEAIWKDVVQMLRERRLAGARCAPNKKWIVRLGTVYYMSPRHRARSACAYIRVCTCMRVQSQLAYPMPMRITRVCGDSCAWTCPRSVVVVATVVGCWSVILFGGKSGGG